MNRRSLRLLGACALAALAPAAPAAAAPGDVVHSEESFEADFNVVEIASGLDFPWSIAFLPDGSMLVSERSGALRHVGLDGTVSEPVANSAEITAVNQGGLLEVSLHPDFEENRLVYLSYATGPDEGPTTALDRGRLSADNSAIEDQETLFTADMTAARGRHVGGRIVWGDDGHLFLALGDGGDYEIESQNTANHWGTVVRLTAEGQPAPGNPFLEDEAAGRPDIWSYGHRNIQGAALHPETRALWTHEHGARGGDEINITRAGENYGWPIATFGIEYDGSIVSEDARLEGVSDPIWYWEPSIAPSGMAFYAGEAFPDWSGDLFVGGLAGLQIQRFEVTNEGVIGMEPLLVELGERIRDVRTGPDGFLYIATDGAEGRILRLEPQEQD